MATIRQLKSGNWNVQIREQGKRISKTFPTQQEAERFALMGSNELSFTRSATNTLSTWAILCVTVCDA